ncbi:MAG TPA: cupin domain-containing protein [Thermoleophilaceae bacterium]|nr:cupin domain-containing protein [Thermoleophilaceae bacterium]
MDELKERLGLEPPPTCGFVRETYRSDEELPASPLPDFDGARARASVLLFLVPPDVHIALDRIRPTQRYHHYLGDPLEVLFFPEDGSGSVETIGIARRRSPSAAPDPRPDMARFLAPPDREYAMLSTTEWPEVEPVDVEVGDASRLAEDYPAFAVDSAAVRAEANGRAAPPTSLISVASAGGTMRAPLAS